MDASSPGEKTSDSTANVNESGRDLSKAVPKHINFGRRTPMFKFLPAFGAVPAGGKKGRKKKDIDMKDVSDALPNVGT